MTFIGLNIPSCNVGHEIENNGKEKPKPLLVGSLPILMGNPGYMRPWIYNSGGQVSSPKGNPNIGWF